MGGDEVALYIGLDVLDEAGAMAIVGLSAAACWKPDDLLVVDVVLLVVLAEVAVAVGVVVVMAGVGVIEVEAAAAARVEEWRRAGGDPLEVRGGETVVLAMVWNEALG